MDKIIKNFSQLILLITSFTAVYFIISDNEISIDSMFTMLVCLIIATYHLNKTED
jgi:hypothetical protein